MYVDDDKTDSRGRARGGLGGVMKASDDEGGSVLGLPEKMLKDELLVERAGSGRRWRFRVLRSREQQEHEEELEPPPRD